MMMSKTNNLIICIEEMRGKSSSQIETINRTKTFDKVKKILMIKMVLMVVTTIMMIMMMMNKV